MAKANSRRTLYFISGVAPTAEQQEEADNMPGVVCFRNALKHRDEDALEDFDAVAGDVPEKYAHAAALKADAVEGQPVAPKASPAAPAAPQQAKPGAAAKPTGAANASAWKPN